jgi:hypothetical protein
VPDYSALGEWPGQGAVFTAPCTGVQAHPQHLNTLGGVVDKACFIDGLNELYEDKAFRLELGTVGSNRVTAPEFTWASVGRRFDAALRSVCGAQG